MKNYTFIFLLVSFFIFTACNNAKQYKGQSSSVTFDTQIEMIQFHSEHRCATCLKIEKLTKQTLEKYYSEIPFRLINVEDKNNEKIAEQFEAFGTSLFIYNKSTGVKKDLTEFAFMNSENADKYETELKKIIEEFING